MVPADKLCVLHQPSSRAPTIVWDAKASSPILLFRAASSVGHTDASKAESNASTGTWSALRWDRSSRNRFRASSPAPPTRRLAFSRLRFSPLVDLCFSSSSSSSSSSSFSLDSHRLYLKTNANLMNSLIDEWIVIVVLVPSFLIVFLAFHHFMISLQCLFVEIGHGVLNGCTTQGRGRGRGKGKGEEEEEDVEVEEDELSSRRRRPSCWCDCGLTLVTACFRLLRSTFSLFFVILFLSSTSVTFISISKSFQTKIPSFGKFLYFLYFLIFWK